MKSENVIQQSSPLGHLSNLGDDIMTYIVSYLDSQYIFAALPLVHKRNQQLLKKILKETKFWKKLYAAPFDIKKSQQDYLENKLNYQVFLLYAAIKLGATDFLLEECQSWNLKIILSILPLSYKKNFILLDFLYHAQLPLTIPYLIRAREKSQNFVQQLKNKLLELKDAGFGYLQLPVDELTQIGHWAEEKNDSKMQFKSAAQFSNILKTLKSILTSDLTKYSDVFAMEKLNYLKLFLKILFWDKNDTDNINHTSKKFQKLLFDTVQSFTLGSYYKNFIFDESKHNQAPFSDCYHPKQINGLLLGVNIGNLHFLEACAKSIHSSFSLNYVFSKTNDHLLVSLPVVLLKEATRKGHTAVVQFLSEQEIKTELQTKMITTNHHHAIHQAICSQNYNLMMLNIAYGGVSPLEKLQSQLLHSTRYIGRPGIDFLALIILTQANISVDVGCSFTLLENLAKDTYSLLKVSLKNSESENKYRNQLTNFLEAIKFLIILGADLGKIKEDKPKAAINYVLKLAQQESKTSRLPLEQENQVSSLYLDSKEYFSYLSKVCFLHNLPETNSSPAELERLELRK